MCCGVWKVLVLEHWAQDRNNRFTMLSFFVRNFPGSFERNLNHHCSKHQCSINSIEEYLANAEWTEWTEWKAYFGVITNPSALARPSIWSHSVGSQPRPGSAPCCGFQLDTSSAQRSRCVPSFRLNVHISDVAVMKRMKQWRYKQHHGYQNLCVQCSSLTVFA